MFCFGAAEFDMKIRILGCSAAERAQLEAKNQALRSELSAASSAPRVEAAARRRGYIPASAGNTSYLDLTPRGR